jgi:glutamine phosphoribosylpyrophosphate amidotransferase
VLFLLFEVGCKKIGREEVGVAVCALSVLGCFFGIKLESSATIIANHPNHLESYQIIPSGRVWVMIPSML